MRRITALFIAFAVLACSGRGKKGDQYKTEKVDRGTITMTVTATGTLSAVTTVQVGSQVSGVISRLYADFNSRVKKGQLLAELDPTPFQQQVEQRQADVTKSKVEAANAKINFERQARLLKAGLNSQADYDATKAAYDGALAQVQQSSAALQQAQTNLRYTKIVSPIDGIVVDRAYDVGQTVAASFQAPTLFQIAQDLTKMQVQADVDQSDIGRIQVGQVARFTVDSYPDQEFRGRIAQIRLNATVSQNVVTYPVMIEVPNPEERLRPKMTANVTIDVAMVADVLRIPNAALRFKPDTSAAGATKTASGSQTSSATPATETATSSAPPAAAAGGQTAQAGGGQQGGGQGGFGGRRRRSEGGGQGGAPTGASPERGMSQMGDRGAGITNAGGGGGWMGGSRGGRSRNSQTVYKLGPDNKLTAVTIRTGITDGRFTQIVEGDLKPGDPIVIGLATSKVEGPPPPGAGGPMGGRGGMGRGR